jgi:hypothetical protein
MEPTGNLYKYIENSYNDYKAKNLGKISHSSTAGPSIDAWDTTFLPPEEYAYEIFEDAQAIATFFPTIIRRYDSPRKITVPKQEFTTADWSSTIAENVRSYGSTKYDAGGTTLDPVDYRTVMAVGRKSIEEATWGVEADVRDRLVNYVALKLDTEAWTCLHGAALSSSKYAAAGESLSSTYHPNAVDYDTGLSVDNTIDAIYNIRNATYNRFQATDAQVTAATVKELVKESTFVNAAEFGNREFLQRGEFATFLGLRWEISGNIPQDSGSTDIGLIYDRRRYIIANVPHEFELATARRYETDEIEWFAKCKAAFKIGAKKAGAVLYT